MIGKNKISGVVCEFNPLHNGHTALLSRISEEFGSDIVCVMSGNFVQRGEAAVLDKWSRTRLARHSCWSCPCRGLWQAQKNLHAAAFRY